MQRVLEPEIMDGEEQARAYAEADFEQPNSAFIEQLGNRFGRLPSEARVIDLGCGPGDIAVRLAGAFPGWRIDAVDGSEAMLRHAREAAARCGLEDRVRPVLGLVPSVALEPDAYDIVLSNSLLHHLPDPLALWATVARVGRCSAPVMVVDLERPSSREAANRIVETYSGGEPEVLKHDFLSSLLAAFTVDEVRSQLAGVGLVDVQVEAVSDRHLLVAGRLPLDRQGLEAARSRIGRALLEASARAC